MKKKSFVIIGGGLSGCASALYLRAKGHKVSIYEKDKQLGGITKDLKFDKQRYLNGPNYLNPDSPLIKLIKKKNFFKNNIDTKKILYGSYTDLFGKKIFSEEFAHPISFEKLKINNFFLNKVSNLLERIEYYPTETRKELTLWCSRFENELDKIHHECSHVLGIGRLYFKKNEKEILKLKKKSKFFDDILGLPNFKNNNNKFCIPKNGYDLFFRNLKKFLIERKIKINLSSKILIKKKDHKISLVSSNKEIKADYYVWACNPVPLLNSLNIGKLDNPIIKTQIITCDLVSNYPKIQNRYIQVFSKISNIFRIYIYCLQKNNKISLELMLNKKKIDINKELKFALKILSKFGYNFTIKGQVNEVKQIRHILYTNNDYKKFMNFEKISKDYKIISGGWYLNGSKAKMEHIQNIIKEFNI